MNKDFPIKEIGVSNQVKNSSYAAPVIMLIGGVILFLVTKRIVLIPFVFGVLGLVLSTQTSKHKIFKFYEKHFVVQLGPITSKKLINYNKLKNFFVENNKIHISYTDEKEKLRTIKIPSKSIEQEGFNILKSELEKKKQITKN